MTARVLISGDKRNGFTWRIVENGNVLHFGNAQTEPKAVVAGQDALIEHNQKPQGDGPRAMSRKVIPGDKFSTP